MNTFNFDKGDPYNLGPANFFDASEDFDAQLESFDTGEGNDLQEGLALLYYNLPDLDKIKVFLTSMKSPAFSRHR